VAVGSLLRESKSETLWFLSSQRKQEALARGQEKHPCLIAAHGEGTVDSQLLPPRVQLSSSETVGIYLGPEGLASVAWLLAL
jgi:hypothetical protein